MSKPKPTLTLDGLEQLSGQLQQAELEVARRRLRLNQAIAAALKAGVSQSAIARTVGVSRQRIWKMSEELNIR